MNTHEFSLLIRKKISAEADALAKRNGESIISDLLVHRLTAGKIAGMREAIRIIEQTFRGGEEEMEVDMQMDE
jgi:hypothetical protein